MASWLLVNGLWIEVPVMVNHLPEGWALGSYLVLIIQFANIGPLTFAVINRLNKKKKRIEIATNYIIITIGLSACMLLVPLWDVTSYVNGVKHSTALLSLSAFLALTDCTSSVSYLAFMTMFPPTLLTSFFVGMGMNPFIVSVFGLLQGVSGNPRCINSTRVNVTAFDNLTVNVTDYETEYRNNEPRFAVEVYFLLLFGVLLISLVSYIALVHLKVFKQFHLKLNADTSRKVDIHQYVYLNENTSTEKGESPTLTRQSLVRNDCETDTAAIGNIQNRSNNEFKLGKLDWVYFLAIQAYSSGLFNSVMPSIQSYSTLPYGNLTYHLAIIVGLMMVPTASLCVHWFPVKTKLSVGVLTMIGTIAATYIITVAALSPYPPLCGSVFGGISSIMVWIVFYFVFTYIKISIGMLFRSEGRNGLIWYGSMSQIGSLFAAISIFPVVNVLQLFQQDDPCSTTCY
uniref:Riboflavin transporter n=1 Tax=Saccoglossus kowalevskii TaxID=10224 RepID=A0ABM0GNU6_SACKO|nr:PREDICTED: solute carrier family 52, riboflavin transporter, member 3-B-like [Saccoglossus kowalevskii]